MSKLTIKNAYHKALGHYQNGMLAEAADLVLKILDHDPRHLDSLQLMGSIACHSGRDDLAIPYFEKACNLAPHSHQLLSDLGETHRRAGNLESAMAAFHRAIVRKPDYAEAHNNLGVALRDGGRMREALAAFRQAVAFDPHHLAAQNNLGAALLETENLDEAVAIFLNLVALVPNDADALVNLGATLAKLGKFEPAITAYRQAIVLDPNLTVAFRNLGNALEKTDCLDEAVAAYQQALLLEPGLTEVHNNLGNAWRECGRLDDALASYRRALEARPSYSDAYSNLLFSLHYSSAQNARSIFEEHNRWNSGLATRGMPIVQPHPNESSPARRLRIGYVSPDFRSHPVARFLLPLLENHDKAEVEIFTYAQGRASDGWTERLMIHADHQRNLTDLTDNQAADLIRGDQIDILVDLALHTAGNRLLVFARKPAPVQVTWLAYAGTSGLVAMDYRLSDPYLDPLGADESVYSEKTFRLPQNYWCYQSDHDLPIFPSPLLENGHVTFGSLNNFCKVNDEVINLWSRVLAAVSDSRLRIHSKEGAHRRRMLDVMQRRGIGPERIRFTSNAPMDDYFKQYNEIDIALDPFPYGGGTTTCDALWMGAPVITLKGRTAVGRGGSSILSNIGLPELVANCEEDYLRIAMELANDQPRLTGLRSTMRDRMRSSPLMDGSAFARAMEAAYRKMWQTWCDTKPSS